MHDVYSSLWPVQVSHTSDWEAGEKVEPDGPCFFGSRREGSMTRWQRKKGMVTQCLTVSDGRGIELSHEQQKREESCGVDSEC